MFVTEVKNFLYFLYWMGSNDTSKPKTVCIHTPVVEGADVPASLVVM